MKKNIKIVEISGIRGFLVVTYAIICAAAGFILFPAWALMSLWNLFGIYVYKLPTMNLIHGFMLYAIIVLLYFATNSRKSFFGISSANISDSHIAAIMKDIDEKK